MVAGQSNANRVAQYGEHSWDASRNASDTFVNCADDGTTTVDWQPGGAVMNRALTKMGNTAPDVILWMQGESDAFLPDWSNYEQRTVGLFNYFRSKWPGVPIVFAQIGTIDPNIRGTAKWDEIKAMQARLTFPNSVMVRTDDLPGLPTSAGADGLHFTAQGDQGIAIRFFQGYRELGG